MQKVKMWLRRWLGIDGLRESVEMGWRDQATRDELAKAERDAAIKRAYDQTVSVLGDAVRETILKSQGFVPLMNQRIEALEQTSVNGLGVEAIVDGRLDLIKERLADINRYLEIERQAGEDLARALDTLNALKIQERLIDIETTNKAPIEKPPEVSPAGSWTETVNRIENGTRGKRRAH